MNQNNKLVINGNEYEIIGYVPISSGNFIVYTDGKLQNNGQVNLYVNRILEEKDEIVFSDVKNEEVVKVINVLKERISNNE